MYPIRRPKLAPKDWCDDSPYMLDPTAFPESWGTLVGIQIVSFISCDMTKCNKKIICRFLIIHMMTKNGGPSQHDDRQEGYIF